jgi:MFS family permease
VTYRAVLRNREFVALLLSQGLSVAGDQLARIAVAVLVFDRTGSAFTASATYAMSYLTYLLGGPVLSAISDRRPRLRVMVVCDLVRAPLMLSLCFAGIPLWVLFVVLGMVGAFGPPFDSARSAMQPDILTGEVYVLGNALMQLVTQSAQVLGFGLGGALVAATSARAALAIDGSTFLLSAGALLLGLRLRPAAQAANERQSLYRDTLSGIRLVGADPTLRLLLSFAVLGTASVIATEGLAVPVAHELGHGALAAGLLTAAVPLGYLAASMGLLRIAPDRRPALMAPLIVIGCVPLLVTPASSSVPVVALLWFVAGAGGAVNLIASSAFMQACPGEYRSRAYGVANTCLYAAQGAALLLAGLLASPFGSRGSVAALAVVTLGGLGVASRMSDFHAQGLSRSRR